MRSYLNLGCGNRFHPDWINVDFAAADHTVLSHDLRKGVPFPDAHFDVVYHSHLLEHFSRPFALSFLGETHRVLKSGGITRIAVPDLERTAKGYLTALEEAARGDKQGQQRYEWMIVELLDQTVRERPGGEMGSYLQQAHLPDREFVIERLGVGAQEIIEGGERVREQSAAGAQQQQQAQQPSSARTLSRLRRAPAALRESLLKLLLGDEYRALELGRFRSSGDPHLWMYDRYSLARALESVGFREPRVVGPAESSIPGWTQFNLDTEPDGTVYKPDSFYVEARKA
jgi:predicted SAM-dependent methyltransferase